MTRLAELIGLILASGEAVALVVMVFTVTLHPGPGDPELIAAVTTLAGATLGAVSGWLLRRGGGPDGGPDGG